MEYICLGQLSSGPPPLPLSLLYYINIIQHASLYLTRAKNSISSLQKKGERERDCTMAAAAANGKSSR